MEIEGANSREVQLCPAPIYFDAFGPSHWPCATTEWMTDYGIYLLNGSIQVRGNKRIHQPNKIRTAEYRQI